MGLVDDVIMRRADHELGKDGHEDSGLGDSGLTTALSGDPMVDSPVEIFHDCVGEPSISTLGDVRRVTNATSRRLEVQD